MTARGEHQLATPAVAAAGEADARVEVLGCPVDAVRMGDAVAACERFIDERGFAQHMAINAAKLVAMHDDPALRQVIERCDLITADGQAVVWAARVLGRPLPERVAGIDLMEALFARCEERGHRPYILGARREVLERAVDELRRRHPALTLAGWRDGYFGDDEAAAVAEEIRRSGADLLFVAISSPRKEYFLGEHGRASGVAFAMGVGGAIDVLAGHTRRAPRWMQVTGLEWLFRLLQEPRRMLRRYVRSNLRFIALVLGERARRRRA